MKQTLSIFALCLFLSACATDNGDSFVPSGGKLSAEQMGQRYLLGRGVPKNDEKAFSYFSRAASEDNPFAENELAFMYFTGKGTKPNSEKAFYWYEKAARHGLASAQYNLGIFYARGIGTQQNTTLAREWFTKAAANQFGPAKKALADF